MTFIRKSHIQKLNCNDFFSLCSKHSMLMIYLCNKLSLEQSLSPCPPPPPPPPDISVYDLITPYLYYSLGLANLWFCFSTAPASYLLRITASNFIIAFKLEACPFTCTIIISFNDVATIWRWLNFKDYVYRDQQACMHIFWINNKPVCIQVLCMCAYDIVYSSIKL